VREFRHVADAIGRADRVSPAAFAANAAGREAPPAARFAALAAGQAVPVAVVHVAAHELGAAAHAIRSAPADNAAAPAQLDLLERVRRLSSPALRVKTRR